ncbi:hypothetical protein ABZ478_30055 [Streptomyces sp. NPDC005706]|uniref:hypothetical protein n=1 Tax=Streptomyces sp. NPDC005706 TaxID=3157169 RepID=UPI00340F70D2
MAAEVSGTFEYRITHIVSQEGRHDHPRTIALTNDDAGRLERLEQRRNEAYATCDHCGARLLVALPSFAEVRGERRRHGLLWKVCAPATVLSGYGFLHMTRTATGTGHGPGIAFVVTVAATLFFAYRTLISGMLSRSNGGPDVTPVDRRELGNVRHSWTYGTAVEDA